MATRKNRVARRSTSRNSNVSLFAVYAFNAAADSPCAQPKGCFWTYPRLPAGWHWVGKGTVHPMGKDQSLKEEQFMGPLATRHKAKEILHKKFASLTPTVVTKFKIVNRLT